MRGLSTFVAACAAAIAILSPNSSQARDEPKFAIEPTGDWKVDRRSDRCRLSREFGSGKESTSLRIDQGGPEPFYTLTLVGKTVRHPYGRVIRVQFGPQEEPIYRGYITAKSNKGMPALVMYGVTLAPSTVEQAEGGIQAISQERKTAITRLLLSRSIVKPFALEIGSMGEPLERLQNCAIELARKLDLPNLITSEKSRPATLKIGEDELAERIYYPRDLLGLGMEGRIDFRLTVDERGKPTACHILATNRPQMFDDAVCLTLMKEAKFEPALDAQGRPQASYYAQSIRFTIE